MNTHFLRKAGKPLTVTVLAVSTFLLVTMGGAIFAAPVTVPLLVMISRSRTGWMRTAAAVIAALTLTEVAWAVTYVSFGEATPWIWALPLIVGLTTIASLLTSGHRHVPSPSSELIVGRRCGTNS